MENEIYCKIIQALSLDDPSVIEQLDKNLMIHTINHGEIALLEFAVMYLSANVVKYLVYNGAAVDSHVIRRLQSHIAAATHPQKRYSDEKIKKINCIEKVLLPYL